MLSRAFLLALCLGVSHLAAAVPGTQDIRDLGSHSPRNYPTAKCGDGVVQGAEECDLGDKNGKPNSGCSADCKKVCICGNGILETGEEVRLIYAHDLISHTEALLICTRRAV